MLDQAFLDYFILFSALLLIVGVLATKFSSRFGVPALILFILVGMISGTDGLGLIHFENTRLAELIGILALIIILFEGGLQTKWSTVKPVAIPSLSLSTLGVLFTSAIVAVAAKLLFDVTWLEGLLFGAIVGSTDAAAVFAVMKGQNIKPRLRATLEAESGSNDPMAMILTLSFLELMIADKVSYGTLVGSVFWQIIVGILAGLVFGKLATFAINRINLDSSGLYPVFALAFALLTYSFTDLIGASGLFAVYVSALVIGNSDLTYRQSIFKFNEGFAWMAQILMFTILGLLVFPSQLISLDVIINGLLLSAILIFVARPIAFWLSTIKMGYEFKEKIFLSWAGLKGAVPIVLATLPMNAGLGNGQLFFNVVFFVVLTSALIQGSTITILAEKLKLTGPEKEEPSHTLELVSIGKANAEMIEFAVTEESNLTQKKIAELQFPKGVLVNAIIRNKQLIAPYGGTRIKKGDLLFILVTREAKKELLELLHRK